VSPILVRPVREQLEHDRIIRLLQAKLKRRHEVAINAGEEQVASVKVGTTVFFPDLILTSTDRGRRLEGVVEVETGESVNHLEALAEWAHYSRARAPFHLYVPAAAVDIARRLAAENQVTVAELWTYHVIGDQTRFTLVERAQATRAAEPRKRDSTVSAGASRKTPRTAAPARKSIPAARPTKVRDTRAKAAVKPAPKQKGK